MVGKAFLKNGTFVSHGPLKKLVLTKFPITLLKFQTKLFLTLLKVGISNQVPILMASKVIIEKCNDLDLPIDTSNEIYRLKAENHYLVIPKDCSIYVQMHENRYHSEL